MNKTAGGGVRPPNKTMKIELELKTMDALRLQMVCKQMGNSFRRYRNQGLGYGTVHNITPKDILLLTELSSAITNAQINEDVQKYY